MKLFVKIQTALMQIKNKKGQNTIEYLLMLGVVVGVALLVGGLIKAFMPDLFEQIKGKILGNVGQL
ncbi:hypothetical protein Dip518_000432 [Parelusimicrobium proximum]|uniref:hypothetical protein n=1 Tax=Parelusimicrobium proximum TaxID=3228953 RepID=UPI003D179A7D